MTRERLALASKSDERAIVLETKGEEIIDARLSNSPSKRDGSPILLQTALQTPLLFPFSIVLHLLLIIYTIQYIFKIHYFQVKHKIIHYVTFSYRYTWFSSQDYYFQKKILFQIIKLFKILKNLFVFNKKTSLFYLSK